MATVIKDALPPLCESQIVALEAELGRKLPLQYRDFLMRFNGGYPEPDGFLFECGSDGSSVDRFLGVHSDVHDNLLSYVRSYRGRIPEDFLPIAHDPGGNLIVIGVQGEYLGKVFFWDHEVESDDGVASMLNMHLISNGFNEFLMRLHTVEI